MINLRTFGRIQQIICEFANQMNRVRDCIAFILFGNFFRIHATIELVTWASNHLEQQADGRTVVMVVGKPGVIKEDTNIQKNRGLTTAYRKESSCIPTDLGLSTAYRCLPRVWRPRLPNYKTASLSKFSIRRSLCFYPHQYKKPEKCELYSSIQGT